MHENDKKKKKKKSLDVSKQVSVGPKKSGLVGFPVTTFFFFFFFFFFLALEETFYLFYQHLSDFRCTKCYKPSLEYIQESYEKFQTWLVRIILISSLLLDRTYRISVPR